MVPGHGLDRDYGHHYRLGLDQEGGMDYGFVEGSVRQKGGRPGRVSGSKTGLRIVGRTVGFDKRCLCKWFEGPRNL